MGKTGRPRLPEAKRRTLTIGVRVNAREWEGIQRRAAALGVKPTVLLRTAALGRRIRPRPVVPEINRKAWVDLGRLAGNLNQCVRALNRGQGDIPERLIEALRAEVVTLRAALIGAEEPPP